MKLPLQIIFKGVDRSDAIEASIRQHAARLDQFHERIMRCHVVVEEPQHRRRKGNLFRLRIDLTVPGHEIVVNHDPGLDHAHEDMGVAIRDAFKAAARQLEDYARRQRGDVKMHAATPHGRVKLIFPGESYGIIETPDGLDVYFHANSVAGGDFSQLNTGDEVRFVAQDGESDKGPQASTVIPIGKHHVGEPEHRR
jgi:cold shock CspA family protein/ribosome-associated translation inhibitor RaiA